MPDRRNFIAVLAGTSWAAVGCASEPTPSGDDLERALEELNQAAGLGIADDDLAAALGYAAGTYREAAKSLRTIPLESSLDLPVAFSAKRRGE